MGDMTRWTAQHKTELPASLALKHQCETHTHYAPTSWKCQGYSLLCLCFITLHTKMPWPSSLTAGLESLAPRQRRSSQIRTFLLTSINSSARQLDRMDPELRQHCPMLTLGRHRVLCRVRALPRHEASVLTIRQLHGLSPTTDLALPLHAVEKWRLWTLGAWLKATQGPSA